MWSLGVVVDAPAFDEHLHFTERIEYHPVQKLVTELAVKYFVVAVLPGTAGLDEQRLHAAPAEPFPHSRGGERRRVGR